MVCGEIYSMFYLEYNFKNVYENAIADIELHY